MAINSLSTGFRPGVCTSSTRPTAPFTGQMIFETDTFVLNFWNGSAWQGAVSAPAGAIEAYAGSTAPTGWLLSYGQAVSRSTYANLFAVISTTYGSGDGSTTFNLPDLRGRAVAGVDNMGGADAGRLSISNTLGTATGAETHTLDISQIPSVASATHRHEFGFSLLDNYYAPVGSNGAMGTSGMAGAYRYSTSSYQGAVAAGAVTDTRPTAPSVSSGSSTRMSSFGDTQTPSATAGGGGAHNNMQPTIVLNYIIKF